MYQFTGLIKCSICGKNYRGKKQRDKSVYICATHSRDSSKCIRIVLKEEELTYTISKHLAIQGKVIKGELSEYIKSIEVDKSGGYTINYKDRSRSVIKSDNNDYGVILKF